MLHPYNERVPKTRTLNVALIGQGFMGRAHSNAFCQVGHFFDTGFELRRRVICGRDSTRLEAMASRWGWDETTTDWCSVVDRDDIDIIDIATPNVLHAPIAIAAAQAGKIILCEKPLAVSGDEARVMVDSARELPTMVWFNYRRVPAISFARRLIDEGRLGRIFHYRGFYLQGWGPDTTRPPSWKTDKEQAGSGVLGDLLSHAVDTAMYLNGAIREVTAMQQTFKAGRAVDDATLALARFADGSIGSLEATRYAVGFRNRNAFEIHGERGMLRFNLEDFNRLEFFDATEAGSTQGARDVLVTGPDHPYWRSFWKPGHVVGYEHTFIAALADFLTSLTSGERFRPNFADALEVHLVLDAIASSASAGSWFSVTRGPAAPSKV